MVISCIIPFYNESERVVPILDVVSSCKMIDEIILVDDGSTDGGVGFKSPRFVVHRFQENKGKSEAMRHGFNIARGDIILFIDADLKGLNHSHINKLLQPLLSGKADVAVSMREHLTFFDVVSGERALKKDTWKEFFKTNSYQRNAMEMAMNYYALTSGLTIQWIPWEGVSQTYKSQKTSWLTGVVRDVRNVVDWIFQLGIFAFGCTYLLSWLTIIDGNSWLTRKYRDVYMAMYRF